MDDTQKYQYILHALHSKEDFHAAVEWKAFARHASVTLFL
jgi:hypothetical protein